jgi:hypothetical protein
MRYLLQPKIILLQEQIFVGFIQLWQIDDKEQIHAGKIMQYDRFTGKRVKEPYNHVNWLHKAFKEPEFNLSQCLFGLHRITEDYQKNNCNCRK